MAKRRNLRRGTAAHVLHRIAILASAAAIFGGAVPAQTLNLPATLNSGTYSAVGAVTNCTGAVSRRQTAQP